jgi:LAO/AO transport system kinase
MSDVKASALDRRALGLELTRVANFTASDELAAADPPATTARRIGVTGAPGAGKSTLAGRLAVERLSHGALGVLAIDPTSAKSGGAILGDRVRMDDLPGAERLFIRSFGSRTATDGLADNLPELLDTMDRYGFDEVIVETVGVGQADWAARLQVDTLVLVLPPDAGDIVQAMKAGIIEMADIFVINKADLPAASRMASEIKRIVALTRRDDAGWTPPVLLAAQANPESIGELSRQIDRHLDWLQATGMSASRLLLRRKYRLRRWLERQAQAIIDRAPATFFDTPRAEQARALLRQLHDDLER